MAKIIRKQTDLSKDSLRAIKILAAMQDTNAKNYIETLIYQHVKANTGQIKSIDKKGLIEG